MMNRREFIASGTIAAVLAPRISAADKGETAMDWGALLHLGYNFWDDAKALDHVRCDEAMWREATDSMARQGLNFLLIDLGEAVEYPSHPELAVKGGWNADKLRKELERLRGIGIEPIPKLNFSTAHDAWLKEYGRMVSTPAYYAVCRDLIRDVCEMFGSPRLFHLGFDEENAWQQRKYPMTVIRQGDLWWHDLLLLAGEVEKCGARPWVWSDKCWGDRWEEFEKKMPRSILQSNWYYYREFTETAPHNRFRCVKAYDKLDKAGFDQIPTGSNWDNDDNMSLTVGYCREHISGKRLKGFMTAPWKATLPENRDRVLKSVEQLGRERNCFRSSRFAT